MNKTTLTTIILDAAIILAVSLFMFVIRPWDKADKKDQADYAPVPELTIAEQEGIEPVEPVVGNSKPVDVEPVEGIRITAPANALDKDREFKITPVDEKTWEEADKRIADVSGEKMLFCFDLDAGMEPDEHLPGEFTLSMDLAKMGIPPILYDKISVWRKAGDQLYKYTSWLENGKLTFRSDQNCLITLTIPTAAALIKTTIGALALIGAIVYGYETWDKHTTTGDLYKSFFTMNNDAVKYEIKDKYGDFTVYFRFKDTEYSDRFETYKESGEKFVQRSKELDEKAETEYARQVEEKYNEDRADWTTWQKIMGSAEAKKKARAAIDKAAILAQLCKEDVLLKSYAEGMQIPPSIQDLDSMFRQANRYLTDDQGLRPQTCNLEVDLIDTGPSGEYRRTASKLPYMVINYSKMLNAGGTYTRKGRGESMLITVTHELFHHRQKTHNWPCWMDFRSEETTAAYMETYAADYYLKKGYMTTNINHPAKGAETEFVQKNFDPAPRGDYEVFGRDFNSRISSGYSDWAYTYADLMDYIQEHKKMKPLKGSFIMDQYAYTSSYKANYMKWFGITDEKELEKWIRLFCVDSLEKIKYRQENELVKVDNPSLASVSYVVTRKNPIKEARTECDGLVMRTFCVECQNLKQGDPFNAFIVRGKGCTPDDVWFYTSSDQFKKDKSESTYFHSDSPQSYYYGAYFQAPSFLLSGLPFTIVALFQPEKPEVTKVKKDYIKFKVPTPEKSLLKNKYVTGMLYTLRDKNGNERNILAPAGKFGKEVKWKIDGVGDTDFALFACWIGEGDEARAYSSPESEPFVHGSVPSDVNASANVTSDKKADKKKAKEEKKAKEKEVKNDSQEKLVEEKRYIDNPFERIVIFSALPDGSVPECKVPIQITDRTANAIDTNAPNGLGRPCTYLTNDWEFTEENSEIKIASRGDGYVLTIKSMQTRSISNNSLSIWLRGSPDQTYDFTIELIFNEELELVSGKVKENVVFYMKIEPYYYVIEKNKYGDNVERRKDDGKGLRWEKCTYEATYSFIVDNRDARHFSINDYSMKAITKEHERNSPNVATFEWSAGKEDINGDGHVYIDLKKKK